MKLFEIDNKIKEVLDEITIDPDTGLLVESYRVDETTGETVDLNSELENLILQRDEKIKNVALYYLNLVSDANELEEQEKKFKARKDACKKKAERLKEFLSYYLNGEKKEFTECTIKFGKSKSVEVDSDFVKWAEQNNKTEYLRYKDPEPDKIKLKEVLSKNSDEVPHCHLIEKLNLSIK